MSIRHDSVMQKTLHPMNSYSSVLTTFHPRFHLPASSASPSKGSTAVSPVPPSYHRDNSNRSPSYTFMLSETQQPRLRVPRVLLRSPRRTHLLTSTKSSTPSPNPPQNPSYAITATLASHRSNLITSIPRGPTPLGTTTPSLLKRITRSQSRDQPYPGIEEMSGGRLNYAKHEEEEGWGLPPCPRC